MARQAAAAAISSSCAALPGRCATRTRADCSCFGSEARRARCRAWCDEVTLTLLYVEADDIAVEPEDSLSVSVEDVEEVGVAVEVDAVVASDELAVDDDDVCVLLPLSLSLSVSVVSASVALREDGVSLRFCRVVLDALADLADTVERSWCR